MISPKYESIGRFPIIIVVIYIIGRETNLPRWNEVAVFAYLIFWAMIPIINEVIQVFKDKEVENGL